LVWQTLDKLSCICYTGSEARRREARNEVGEVREPATGRPKN